jgi:hypothetical protein
MLNLHMENRILITVGLYLCFIFAVIVYKPGICYTDEGGVKHLGSNQPFTILALSVILAVLSYSITIGFAVLNKFVKKNVNQK